MNTEHYINILAIKDSLIEKLHDRIGELEANLAERVAYEKDLKKQIERLQEYEWLYDSLSD
jgi:hypothetical protein|tara:strand:+ start:2204 stop:2386 length:183 start_codon:yes stop_codon:yes gene_type:complete